MKRTKVKLEYRTVFLSDTHLGMRETGIQKLNHFLSHISCKTLVLNGDFIDGWALEGSGEWKKAHTRCVRLILKMVEKEKTKSSICGVTTMIFYLEFFPSLLTELKYVKNISIKEKKANI